MNPADTSVGGAAEAPLLESSGGRLLVGGAVLLEFGAWRAEGRGACLVGGFEPLVRWFLHDAELEGGLRLGGWLPHEGLRCGALGLSLAAPSWDASWTVAALLEASASLAGAAGPQIARVLDKTRLTRHRGVRLGQLNAPLRRLLSLATAAVTEPEVLILEHPFAGLDDDAAQFLETVLADLTEGRRWIGLVDVGTPWERRLCERADAGVFVVRSGAVLGPFGGSEWLEGPVVYWVHLVGDAGADALRAQGAQVDAGPAPESWIVRGLSGRRIVEVAASAGAQLRELVPLSHAASCY
jgi:hypothetical protein